MDPNHAEAASERPRLRRLSDVVADDRYRWAKSKSQMLRLCASGQPPHHRIGKAIWVSDDDLAAFEASTHVSKPRVTA